ncbi:MAG: hypothetical protein WBV40_05150, partial [Candidatus Cybelea sp.]
MKLRRELSFWGAVVAVLTAVLAPCMGSLAANTAPAITAFNQAFAAVDQLADGGQLLSWGVPATAALVET